MLPAKWQRRFKVRVDGTTHCWTHLLFGWKYNPVVCQRVVQATIQSAVYRLKVFVFVYLDGILFEGGRLARQAPRLVVPRLCKAGFLISHKSMFIDPFRQLGLIGKHFNKEKGEVHNKQGLLVGVIALWLRMNLRPFSHKTMSWRLGRLEWALRPNAGLGPFLAGAYCWKEGGTGRHTIWQYPDSCSLDCSCLLFRASAILPCPVAPTEAPETL